MNLQAIFFIPIKNSGLENVDNICVNISVTNRIFYKSLKLLFALETFVAF